MIHGRGRGGGTCLLGTYPLGGRLPGPTSWVDVVDVVLNRCKAVPLHVHTYLGRFLVTYAGNHPRAGHLAQSDTYLGIHTYTYICT